MLAPHLTEHGYVVSCQNGLNELVIAESVGKARTIGAFVNFGADWEAPGHIAFGNRGAVVLGELDGQTTARLTAPHTLHRRGGMSSRLLTDDLLRSWLAEGGLHEKPVAALLWLLRRIGVRRLPPPNSARGKFVDRLGVPGGSVFLRCLTGH